jgi:transposase
MSSPKQFTIKESIGELRKLQKGSIPMIANRIRALIEFKKYEKSGISKRSVSDSIGVNHNSVQTWRNLYIHGGISKLMEYTKQEGRPSIITDEEHKQIEAKLKDPKNNLRGYVELQDWIEKEFKKPIKYNTILKYSVREFGSKVKVARKSHVKKDEKAVEAFKKTSLKNARK